MRGTGALPAALLFLLALATGWMLWRMWQPEPDVVLVGPPRSDYFLLDFELVALDKQGKESFHAVGPRLSRHPYLESITVESPRFSFPDPQGGQWTAQANEAWVDGDGDQLRLTGNVSFDGPPESRQGAVSMRTQELSVFPETRTVTSPVQVTVTMPGSILRGYGLQADLATRRLVLLSEIEGHYEPRRKNDG